MPPWGTRTSATATLLVVADGAVNDNDSNAPAPIANAHLFMSATIIAGHSRRGSAEAPLNYRPSCAAVYSIVVKRLLPLMVALAVVSGPVASAVCQITCESTAGQPSTCRAGEGHARHHMPAGHAACH